MASGNSKQCMTDVIKAKAYELWDKDGRKSGNDLYYWLQAEKSVKSQSKKSSSKSW